MYVVLTSFCRCAGNVGLFKALLNIFVFIIILNLLECLNRLGMRNNAISDGHISASTQFDANHAAIQGRLNFQKTATKAGSWSAATKDVHQWLQIDLGSLYTKVTRVITQGRHGLDQWVTKYKLQYGDDGVNFQYYREQGQNVDKVKDTL